jgi:hypothetical protein
MVGKRFESTLLAKHPNPKIYDMFYREQLYRHLSRLSVDNIPVSADIHLGRTIDELNEAWPLRHFFRPSAVRISDALPN